MADEIDNIDIDSLLRSYDDRSRSGLKERYELKLTELSINQTQALEIMGIQSRALNGVLEGTSPRLDITALLALAKFLDIPKADALNLYLDALQFVSAPKMDAIDKRKFITQNFDLLQLKKAGLIHSTTDFEQIEETLVRLFNFDSIFDYRKDVLTPAFSSAKLHKDSLMSNYWIEFARHIFRKINNPNEYNRQSVIDYFPIIRWHSMNVEKGLWEVIRAFHQMGVTIIYLPKFSTLHLRGATFAVNGKPCIVLTDYRGYYPTLWFALLHELHHVLFDWEDIKLNTFHLSGDTDLYTEEELEREADKFARDYLFDDIKMKELIPHIKDRFFVEKFAQYHQVHKSIPYIFYAFDKDDKYIWMWVQQFMPEIDECIKRIGFNPWEKTVKENAKLFINYNSYEQEERNQEAKRGTAKENSRR